MKLPTLGGFELRRFEELASTQTTLADLVRAGEPVGIVFAENQTTGRGRFDRVWLSERGDSLTVSLAFHEYADHPQPYLIGMQVAIAAASALHCQLRWPNDLTFEGRKLGGILTEIIRDKAGRSIPVVGVGINLNQSEFAPEIAETATSALRIHGGRYDAFRTVTKILDRLQDFPEPTAWADLQPSWEIFDATPGKMYKLPSGELAVAIGVGSNGQLICSVDGESHAVFAADAIFGTAQSS